MNSLYCKASGYAVSVFRKDCIMKLGFPKGRDSAIFPDKGTEVPSLSWDKGTMGQAKNLAKGRDEPGQPKFGTGRDSQNPGQDAGKNGTEQKRTF